MGKIASFIKQKIANLWLYNLQSLIAYISNIILPTKLIDAIIIECHNDFDGNGGALYDYLLDKGYNKQYTIVVFLHYKLDRILPEGVRAYSIYGPCILRAYYSCRAKFLFADNHCHKKYKKDQINVYLSHSIPLKNTYGFIKLKSYVDYCLSPSEWFDSYVRKAFTIENNNTKLIHIGYPRLDVLYKESESDLPKITMRIFKKKILWMPTFRRGGSGGRNDVDYDLPLGVPLLNTDEDVARLNEFLVKKNMLLVVKIHPKQERGTVKIKSMSNIIVLTLEDIKKKDIDNFRLYKDMDAMISDYSSASFDFMHLDRPLCFDFSDLSHYKLGLIMDNPDDFLPGDKIYDIEDMKKFLVKVANDEDAYAEKRKEVFDKLFEYHDGNSCERIVKFFGI